MIEFTIRKTKLEDLDGVMRAHRKSIQDLCAKDYSKEQVLKWSDVNYDPDIWRNTVENDYHLVVEADGVIEGFSHAKIDGEGIGHIVGLYFTSKIAGRGIGREVFDKTIEWLKTEKCPKVRIIGTITARGFYEKMGFSVIEKRQLTTRGATLDCYRMERALLL